VYELPDGEQRCLEVRSTAIDTGGEFSLVAVVRDVTESRALARQLEHAQRGKSIRRLAGGLAYELNGILTGLATSNHLLREQLPAQRELVESELLLTRANVLVRQLLAFSRRQPIEAAPIDVGEVLASARVPMTAELGKGIELVLDRSPQLPRVLGDRRQLEQLVVDLCASVRHTLPHGGKLHVATRAVCLDAEFCAQHDWAHPGDYVELSIRDDGAGMSPAQLQTVFEPFASARPGLALAAAYGIVKQNEGLIDVTSVLGHGTHFRIYLPLAKVSLPLRPPRTGTLPHIVTDSATILLAEDDDGLRRIATRILEGCGYRVLACANGHEAVETFDRRQPMIELVVLDAIMPSTDLGGVELYELLRQRTPAPRFLFISGYAENTTPPPSNDTAFLYRPFTPADLARCVREMLERGRPRA
jgi:nitrogen-specific signal transduction histidine kinase